MTSFPKSDVIRIVCADGKPVIDLTGKMNGRGSYLCRSMDCFDLAVKKKRIKHALGVTLTPEEIEEFREEYAKALSYAEVTE